MNLISNRIKASHVQRVICKTIVVFQDSSGTIGRKVKKNIPCKKIIYT